MSESDSFKVKPCPFCGSEGLGWYVFDIPRAGCSDEKCPASFLHDGVSADFWNKRTTPPTTN